MKYDIADYVDKVYAYALKRTYSREEADDLSQEILFCAVRELPRLRDCDRFEPWLWGIANNVTLSFKRKLGKQRAMFSYDDVRSIDIIDETEDGECEALYSRLRSAVAILSKKYRDIIILHYYDGLSVKEISEKLNIPEGTVTWRLSEARRKIKGEYINMEESALRPKKLHLDIYGSGNYDGKIIPFPHEFIKDALSQNILYYCYEEARSIEILSKLCGVPAYYIEERLENLKKRGAVIEEVRGKYRTNFIIWSDKHGIYCEENAEKALLPIIDKMMIALKNIAGDAKELDFYRAGKSDDDLFYLYGIMAFDYAKDHFCILPCPPIPEAYDGFPWRFIGNIETGAHKRIGINTLVCRNNGSRGSYMHLVYIGLPVFCGREMMYDSYINVCEDILSRGNSEDIDSLANAISEGYIEKRNDEFFITVPALDRNAKAEFDKIVRKHLAPLMDEYSKIVHNFVNGYKKLFPRHLSDDVDRMCHGMFQHLCTVIFTHALRMGKIPPPTPNSYCDVLIQKQL